MPIYEYQCGACGHLMEAFQKMTEAPLTICPQCQKESLQKMVSAAGFQLKGTGWYATDFKNKGKQQVESSGGSQEKKDKKPDSGQQSNSSDTAAK